MATLFALSDLEDVWGCGVGEISDHLYLNDEKSDLDLFPELGDLPIESDDNSLTSWMEYTDISHLLTHVSKQDICYSTEIEESSSPKPDKFLSTLFKCDIERIDPEYITNSHLIERIIAQPLSPVEVISALNDTDNNIELSPCSSTSLDDSDLQHQVFDVIDGTTIDDAEWQPAATKSNKRRRDTLTSKISSVDEEYVRKKVSRQERKKVQNKDAATRYRQKKRDEKLSLLDEEACLLKLNKSLSDEVQKLELEVSYMKKLMVDIFKSRGKNSLASKIIKLIKV